MLKATGMRTVTGQTHKEVGSTWSRPLTLRKGYVINFTPCSVRNGSCWRTGATQFLGGGPVEFQVSCFGEGESWAPFGKAAVVFNGTTSEWLSRHACTLAEQQWSGGCCILMGQSNPIHLILCFLWNLTLMWLPKLYFLPVADCAASTSLLASWLQPLWESLRKNHLVKPSPNSWRTETVRLKIFGFLSQHLGHKWDHLLWHSR